MSGVGTAIPPNEAPGQYPLSLQIDHRVMKGWAIIQLTHFKFTNKTWYDLQLAGVNEVYVVISGVESANKQQLYGTEVLDSNIIAKVDINLGQVVSNGGNKHFISTKSQEVYNLIITCMDREGRDIDVYLEAPRFDVQLNIY